jgi:UDP-N-acetylmuramoyl-tripeptide--D-alanyl-D-alanine ligase
MNPLTLEQLEQAVGGKIVLGPPGFPPQPRGPINRIVTDSRAVRPGDVFWAIPGTTFNGADFCGEAMEKGAVGVVTPPGRLPLEGGKWAVVVDDTLKALWDLARWNRRSFAGTVIGVTGSVGKTTTRQMIDAVLGVRLYGMASPKNYNNHVGVPFSMLGMDHDHQYAVLELGANHPGEIASLAELCQPAIGVITAAGEAHLEGFGNRQAVAEAKAELLRVLPKDGLAILNGDDDWLRAMGIRSPAPVVWVGRRAGCDLAASQVHFRQGQLAFRADGKWFQVPVWGRHYLTSALAAIAVGRALGLDANSIAEGLARFVPPPGRCQVETLGRVVLVDDTYNANPISMRAAFDLLHDMEAVGRRIVVIGDMLELGPEAARLHQHAGSQVVTVAGADLLVACGEHASNLVQGARRSGMPVDRSWTCRDPEEAAGVLKEQAAPGDVVLFKASRGVGLERAAALFKRQLGEEQKDVQTGPRGRCTVS